jgi:hypothetical protein
MSARSSRLSSRNQLRDLLSLEFSEADYAYDLFDEFLRQFTWDESFCLKLVAFAEQRTGLSWEIRRLAILMLEHQILKLHPDDLDGFDFLLNRIHLKQAPGFDQAVVSSVLKEGYTTTELRAFIPQFRCRLGRLTRIHDRIKVEKTPDAAIHDFIELSRCECKLTLGRYLFTPDEIVSRIQRQLQRTGGVRDLDTSQPQFVDDEITRAICDLPDFEAQILKRLIENADIYWVSNETGSEINSLVEYPTTTVVLVIKPPGSDIEFEIKRAGRKGPNLLNVVYARDGYTVPPSHRLDGGSMQYLLRYEAQSASRFGIIYRLIHSTDAPIPDYIARSSIYAVPVRSAEAKTLTYFTEPQVFGKGFPEMRIAMEESVEAFAAEGFPTLPALQGDLGLSAKFIGVAAPAQAILSGTSSFRLDKLAAYLSPNGPELYFREGLSVSYSAQDARYFADSILEEILGEYSPPDVRYQSHEQYLSAAFRAVENRARADRIYLSLMEQVAKMWGTLLAIRGHSRGESFVARNVGLKSYWGNGKWDVKIIFMDHDALIFPGRHTRDFHAHEGLPCMVIDERYVWARAHPELFPTSEVGYLQSIYRINSKLAAKGWAAADKVLKDAYKTTQHELLTNQSLRAFFKEEFLERLLVWDTLVAGYLQYRGDTTAFKKWEKAMRGMLAKKGYGKSAFNSYMEIIENKRVFFESYSFLFDASSHSGGTRL